jgi:hypothetical protein
MSDCISFQTRFSEYLDGRLTGGEMRRIATHLDSCPRCESEWNALKQTQSSLASLGPVPEPDDLVLRIRVAISQERARQHKPLLDSWRLAWKNTVGPFVFQATAGFASAVLLLGSVTLMVGMFAQPETAQAKGDEPLGNATAPRLLYFEGGTGSSDAINNLSGPVVVEAYVNGEGEVYDYRIVSGPSDAATRSQVENLLMAGVFAPARFFGQPVRGLAVLSFAGVAVRG